MNLTRRILVKASESRWLRERAPRFPLCSRAARAIHARRKAGRRARTARSLADNGISTSADAARAKISPSAPKPNLSSRTIWICSTASATPGCPQKFP